MTTSPRPSRAWPRAPPRCADLDGARPPPLHARHARRGPGNQRWSPSARGARHPRPAPCGHGGRGIDHLASGAEDLREDEGRGRRDREGPDHRAPDACARATKTSGRAPSTTAAAGHASSHAITMPPPDGSPVEPMARTLTGTRPPRREDSAAQRTKMGTTAIGRDGERAAAGRQRAGDGQADGRRRRRRRPSRRSARRCGRAGCGRRDGAGAPARRSAGRSPDAQRLEQRARGHVGCPGRRPPRPPDGRRPRWRPPRPRPPPARRCRACAGARAAPTSRRATGRPARGGAARAGCGWRACGGSRRRGAATGGRCARRAPRPTPRAPLRASARTAWRSVGQGPKPRAAAATAAAVTAASSASASSDAAVPCRTTGCSAQPHGPDHSTTRRPVALALADGDEPGAEGQRGGQRDGRSPAPSAPSTARARRRPRRAPRAAPGPPPARPRGAASIAAALAGEARRAPRGDHRGDARAAHRPRASGRIARARRPSGAPSRKGTSGAAKTTGPCHVPQRATRDERRRGPRPVPTRCTVVGRQPPTRGPSSRCRRAARRGCPS